MATTYKSTISLKCWKEHRCVNCDAAYAYLFKREVTGQGGTADAASQNAHNAAVASMENEVDETPCPTCGLIQPDMVAQGRSARHRLLMWVAVIGVTIAAALYGFRAINSEEATLAAVGVGVLVLVGNLLSRLSNLNSNATANLAKAERRVEAGTMLHSKPGEEKEPDAELFAPKWTGGQKVLFLFMLLGVLLIALPTAWRMVNGWPLNDKWRWPVMGPGDTSRVRFKQDIRSVKGYWRGSAVASATVDGDAKVIPLSAGTKTDSWGNSISVKSSEKDSSASIWADVIMPKDPAFVGKTLTVTIKNNVTYPMCTGNTFQETTTQVQQVEIVKMAATAGAGEQYEMFWLIGMIGGGLLLAATSNGLVRSANAFGETAQPTQLYPYKDENADGSQDRTADGGIDSEPM